MDFYNQVQWNDDLTPYLEGLDFDAAAFAAALDEVVVQPVMKQNMVTCPTYISSQQYRPRRWTVTPFLSTHPTWEMSNIHAAREPM